jgi:hypothetical protein
MGDTVPVVTVALIARNEAAYIGRALDSVIDQGVDDVEILVVDDHSDDDTWSVAASREGVTVVANDGRGIIDAANTYIRLARGPIVVRLDADDWLLPDVLDRILAPFASESVVVVAGGALAYGDRLGEPGDADGPLLDQSMPLPTREHIAIAAMVQNPIVHSGTACRRAALVEVGGYLSTKETDAAEDFGLWVRMLALPGEWVGLPIPVAGLRLRPTSITGTTRVAQRRRARQIAAAHRDDMFRTQVSYARLRDLGDDLLERPGAEQLAARWQVCLAKLARHRLVRRHPIEAAWVVAAAVSLGPVRFARSLLGYRARMERRSNARRRSTGSAPERASGAPTAAMVTTDDDGAKVDPAPPRFGAP